MENLRILVVDEEEPLTHVVRLGLELEGWQVSVAATGAAAIADQTDPHIVLLDMMLPDMRGTDVVAALRERGSTAHVVFLTGRDDLEDRMSAYSAGGDDYVTKPFGLGELVEHVHRATRRLGLARTSRRLGPLVLDTRERLAWCDGALVPLDDHEFPLLLELLEAGGAGRSSDELSGALTSRGLALSAARVDGILKRIDRTLADAGARLLVQDGGGWRAAAPIAQASR